MVAFSSESFMSLKRVVLPLNCDDKLARPTMPAMTTEGISLALVAQATTTPLNRASVKLRCVPSGAAVGAEPLAPPAPRDTLVVSQAGRERFFCAVPAAPTTRAWFVPIMMASKSDFSALPFFTVWRDHSSDTPYFLMACWVVLICQVLSSNCV